MNGCQCVGKITPVSISLVNEILRKHGTSRGPYDKLLYTITYNF